MISRIDIKVCDYTNKEEFYPIYKNIGGKQN